MSELIKHDTGKDPWHLLPWDQVRDVVRVLAYGAQKYSPVGWQTGGPDAPDRYYSAVIRHLVAWRSGEQLDAESGLPHLAHAACGCLFLAWYAARRAP